MTETLPDNPMATFVHGGRMLHSMRRPRHGSVLILVLIVLSSLVALSAGLAYRTRLELRFALAMARQTQALYLARGGIERARVLLNQPESSPEATAAACRISLTADEEQLLQKVDPAVAGHLYLEYAVRDEQSHFNINKSDPASWLNVPGITTECVSTILDWADSDDTPGAGGAETDVYERMETPYAAKNKPCVALRELLFMKDVDPLCYAGGGADPGRSPDDGSDRGRLSAMDFDGGEAPGLASVFTVYGDGKINLNTASPAVMMALPGLEEQTVASILACRAGPDARPGTEDDAAITSMQELSQLDGLSALQIDLLSEYSCFQSEFYRILVYADVDRRHPCCLMASVHVASGRASLLNVERLF